MMSILVYYSYEYCSTCIFNIERDERTKRYIIFMRQHYNGTCALNIYMHETNEALNILGALNIQKQSIFMRP